MNDNQLEREQRFAELEAGRALGDLTPEERRELEQLCDHLDRKHDASLDRTVAAVLLAETTAVAEELPAGARQRALSAFKADPLAAPSVPRTLPPRASGSGAWRSGWLAAAACLVLLAWSHWPWAPASSIERQRQVFLGATADAAVIAWSVTEDPGGAGVTGDVVWSDARQSGYMRFRNLPANDPTQEQYQLWIFDAERDERYPIDGGVFDVAAAAGEAVVPIQAKLPIERATLFAVTVERPGGVVVSSRERLILVADAGGSS